MCVYKYTHYYMIVHSLVEKCGNFHTTLGQKLDKYLLTSLLPLTVTVAGELVTAVEDANSGLLATQA